MQAPEPTADDREQALTHLRSVLRLAGEGVDAAAGIAQDVHRAIADPPLDLLARTDAGQLARTVHNGVRDGTYAYARRVARLVFGVVDRALAIAGPLLRPPPLPSPLIGALHGVVGDALESDGDPLCTRMQLRHDNRVLVLTRDALAAALPDPRERVVVFVHGLAADETCWQIGSTRAWGRPGLDYGHWLAARCGVTPLYLRYNSGRRVADNGRELAALLSELQAAYPATLRSLVLVGHSMGGLVARSACHFGHVAKASWTERVSDVFCLGAPHRGAALEKFGAVAVDALSLLPVTAPIARAIDRRSAGIKDLRHGLARAGTTAALPAARHHDLAGSLGRAGGPLAWVLGDGLVRVASATPDDGRRARTTHIPGAGHLDLLAHPAVLERLIAALDGAP